MKDDPNQRNIMQTLQLYHRKEMIGRGLQSDHVFVSMCNNLWQGGNEGQCGPMCANTSCCVVQDSNSLKICSLYQGYPAFFRS